MADQAAVRNLLDYTIEHQKITITLVTLLIGAFGLYAKGDVKLPASPLVKWCFGLALIFFGLSAGFAGVVAANVAVLIEPAASATAVAGDSAGHSFTWSEIEAVPIGIIGAKGGYLQMPISTWRLLQHTFINLGVIIAGIGGLMMLKHGPGQAVATPPAGKDDHP